MLSDHEKPEILLAPIKGITDLVYRKTFFTHFQGVQRAVAPFFVLSDIGGYKQSTLRKALGTAATAKDSCPQVLSRKGQAMAQLSQILQKMDFPLLNWNLGCPFPKVSNKRRGSGLLPYPEEIQRILEEYYSHGGGPLEVKIRIGFHHKEELLALIPLLNRFPITNLIIHPRLGVQRYSGTPDTESFRWAYENTQLPLTYNGDILTIQDYRELKREFPRVKTWMIGRGLLRDPALGEQITSNTKGEDRRLPFLLDLMAGYKDFYPLESKAVSMTKAHLFYLSPHWKTEKPIILKIKKSQTLTELQDLVQKEENLFY